MIFKTRGVLLHILRTSTSALSHSPCDAPYNGFPWAVPRGLLRTFCLFSCIRWGASAGSLASLGNLRGCGTYYSFSTSDCANSCRHHSRAPHNFHPPFHRPCTCYHASHSILGHIRRTPVFFDSPRCVPCPIFPSWPRALLRVVLPRHDKACSPTSIRIEFNARVNRSQYFSPHAR